MFSLLTVCIPALAALFLQSKPLNHDVAWLLEATRRWVGGAELYREIIEINPPLIFLETVLLSAGLLTKPALLGGVAVAISASALWIRRWHAPPAALLASIVMSAVGLVGFGQRDHLALVFLLPFLMAPDHLGRSERIALAAFAFLGVGLKPYFLLIPGAYLAMRCVGRRSLLPALEIQNLALASMVIVWVAAILLIWPAYVSEIIPLGRFVYSAFGTGIGLVELLEISLIVTVGVIVFIRSPELRPLVAATAGALLCYLLQGRFWSYHLIPALGLAAYMALLAARNAGTVIDRPLLIGGLGLTAINLWLGPQEYGNPFIPKNVRAVLFLADAVPVAYPATLECGVTNASRYPTFWTLPGAWNAMADPQKRAQAIIIFRREVAKGNADIKQYRPAIIYEDMHPPKFQQSFRFSDWFDLSDYRLVERKSRLAIWLRRDLDPSVLTAPPCQAW